jgi:hypothetical protein
MIATRLEAADEQFQDTDWNKIHLAGKRLALIDPVQVEELRFHAKGHVVATIGTGDALAGPIFYWTVKNGILLVYENNDASDIFLELGKPRVKAKPASDAEQILSVTTNKGRQIQYLLSPQQ